MMLICNGCGTTVPAHEDIPHLASCPHHEFGGAWRRCGHDGDCFRPAEEIAA